jgi:hypothetical protein
VKNRKIETGYDRFFSFWQETFSTAGMYVDFTFQIYIAFILLNQG